MLKKLYFLYLGLHIHTSYTLLPLSAERKLFVNCYDLCRKSLLVDLHAPVAADYRGHPHPVLRTQCRDQADE